MDRRPRRASSPQEVAQAAKRDADRLLNRVLRPEAMPVLPAPMPDQDSPGQKNAGGDFRSGPGNIPVVPVPVSTREFAEYIRIAAEAGVVEFFVNACHVRFGPGVASEWQRLNRPVVDGRPGRENTPA